MEDYWRTTWRKTIQTTHSVRQTTKHVRKKPETNRENGEIGRRTTHGRLWADENRESDSTRKDRRQERRNRETQRQNPIIRGGHDSSPREVELRTQVECVEEERTWRPRKKCIQIEKQSERGAWQQN